MPASRVFAPHREERGQPVAGRPPFGLQLRTWRARRRMSQLELSNRAAVSTRHISFLETGRSRPTLEMVLRLAEELDVPVRHRDRMLLAAGHAPRYDAARVDAGPIAEVLAGLRRLLDVHLPNPALLLDEHWDVVDANRAAGLLLEGCDDKLLEPPVNALRVTLHPAGLAPRIRNVEAWAGQLLRQVRQRAEHTFDPVLRDLAAEVTALVPTAMAATAAHGPVLPLDLDDGAGGTLRFVTIATRLEAAVDAALTELHLETLLPADERTRQYVAARFGPA